MCAPLTGEYLLLKMRLRNRKVPQRAQGAQRAAGGRAAHRPSNIEPRTLLPGCWGRQSVSPQLTLAFFGARLVRRAVRIMIKGVNSRRGERGVLTSDRE